MTRPSRRASATNAASGTACPDRARRRSRAVGYPPPCKLHYGADIEPQIVARHLGWSHLSVSDVHMALPFVLLGTPRGGVRVADSSVADEVDQTHEKADSSRAARARSREAVIERWSCLARSQSRRRRLSNDGRPPFNKPWNAPGGLGRLRCTCCSVERTGREGATRGQCLVRSATSSCHARPARDRICTRVEESDYRRDHRTGFSVGELATTAVCG